MKMRRHKHRQAGSSLSYETRARVILIRQWLAAQGVQRAVRALVGAMNRLTVAVFKAIHMRKAG